MPQHIVRLVLILVAFLLIAYAGIVVLTDPSFYRFGHFRADSVPELAAGAPAFRGANHCASCHPDRHDDWSTGSHTSVTCEACHGPGADHPAAGKLSVPTDTVRLCATCHEAMPARPAAHPQLILAEHPYPNSSPPECVNCHDPHSPAIGKPVSDLEPVERSEPDSAPTGTTGSPKIAAKCTSCHGTAGEGVGTFPALVGMTEGDFARAMNAYKSGERNSAVMTPIAAVLSDHEIRTLAKYYAGLERDENE